MRRRTRKEQNNALISSQSVLIVSHSRPENEREKKRESNYPTYILLLLIIEDLASSYSICDNFYPAMAQGRQHLIIFSLCAVVLLLIASHCHAYPLFNEIPGRLPRTSSGAIRRLPSFSHSSRASE